AIDIDRDEPPDIDARSILPALARPRVVVFLACAWNGMERPNELARMHVPRSHVAGRSEGRIFLGSASGDDQIAINSRRRTETVRAGQSAQNLRCVQIHAAAIAERRVRF